MNHRIRSWRLLAFSLLVAIPALQAQQPDTQLLERARALHQRILVLDSHVDILLTADADSASQASLEKLQAGGVDAVVLALAVGPGGRDVEGVREARAEIDAKYAALQVFVQGSRGKAVVARSAAEIEAAHETKRIAVIPGFQNARSLGKDLGAIDALYAQGVRVFGLTHAGHNDWADSSRRAGGPLQEHGGLSALGRQAVAKLNDLGIVIDVSQLTPSGVEQVLALSRAPVIASHSAVRSLVDHVRNLTDAELDSIKKNGGSVQVPAFNAYLHQPAVDFPPKARAIRTRYGLPPEIGPGAKPNDGNLTLPIEQRTAFNDEIAAALGRADVREYVDHIDYIAKRIGIDHVGIGTDFNHGARIAGFENESEAPNVTAELLRRGYTEAGIAKIWGGYFLRVLRAVEAARR